MGYPEPSLKQIRIPWIRGRQAAALTPSSIARVTAQKSLPGLER
jgi:hypothetical protein